jgi:hypothetical protein
MCTQRTRTGREGSTLASLVLHLLGLSRQVTMLIAASSLGLAACGPMAASMPGPQPEDDPPVIGSTETSSCYNALPPGPC